MIDIVFLGTGSMFPTENRAHPSIFVRSQNICFLMDCGEGTQRQMRISGISPTKLDFIFLTHWHGDHSLGLGGIIQSIAANRRTRKLVIYGPKGTSERMNHLLKTYPFEMTYEIEINELNITEGNPKKILETEEFLIEAMKLKHGVPCLAYSFVEKGKRRINKEFMKKHGLTQDPLLGKLQKGKSIIYKGKKITPSQGTYKTPDKKISYVTDTEYFPEIVKLVKNSDILISECTFSKDLNSKAREYTHMTVEESAKLAKKSKSKSLILTHFSQRYTDVSKLKKEAKKIFENVEVAEDLMKISLK